MQGSLVRGGVGLNKQRQRGAEYVGEQGFIMDVANSGLCHPWVDRSRRQPCLRPEAGRGPGENTALGVCTVVATSTSLWGDSTLGWTSSAEGLR